MNLKIVIIAINIVLMSGCVYGRAGIPGRIPILMFRRPELGSSVDQKSLYDWNCRFDRDFCNMKNDHSMALFHRHADQRFPIFGENSLVYVNVSTAGNFLAARLETDYFDSYSQPNACLSITYLMYGTGAVKMMVIQQDIQNKCIWVDENESIDTYGKWREAKFTVNLRDGSPRFFIEAHINVRPPHYGTVAISRVSFTYDVCDYDSTNYCQDQVVQPDIPVSQPHEPPIQPIPVAF